MSERIVGWDIGGAHVKAAVINREVIEQTLQLACPLWRGVAPLKDTIETILRRTGEGSCRHVVTMTGELADIFADRGEGVRWIIEALQACLPEDRLLIFAGMAGFLAPRQAVARYDQVASANWIATAALAANHCPAGLLVDIGSTTTDLVGFSDNEIHARGQSDSERLRYDELIYTGLVRTPVMALTGRVAFEGEWVPLMAECFATAADVYNLLGQLPAHANLLPSADGQGMGVQDSARRLARMLGSDVGQGPMTAWRDIAAYLAECQLGQWRAAIERQLSRGLLDARAPLVGAGVGRFLVGQLADRLNRPYTDFTALLPAAARNPDQVADCAPAVSVALLMRRYD